MPDHRSRRVPGAQRALVVGVIASLVAAACSASSTSTATPTAPPSTQASATPVAPSPTATLLAPATIDLWLGGVLTTSTPGSPYDMWVQHVITRFKAAN